MSELASILEGQPPRRERSATSRRRFQPRADFAIRGVHGCLHECSRAKAIRRFMACSLRRACGSNFRSQVPRREYSRMASTFCIIVALFFFMVWRWSFRFCRSAIARFMDASGLPRSLAPGDCPQQGARDGVRRLRRPAGRVVRGRAIRLETGYFIFWEMVTNGRSPGKMLVGLRVVRRDGMRNQPQKFGVAQCARGSSISCRRITSSV